MSQPDSPPLTGYRVAVTSARRAEELCVLLRRQGAEVCSAAAINMIALPDDSELHSNTNALIAEPPDILIAHTGIGFRGWVAAAEGWGLADKLIEGYEHELARRNAEAQGNAVAEGHDIEAEAYASKPMVEDPATPIPPANDHPDDTSSSPPQR